MRAVGGVHFFSGRCINPKSANTVFSGSMSPPVEHFESQDFRQPPGRRPAADTANSFCGPVFSHGPGVTFVGGT